MIILSQEKNRLIDSSEVKIANALKSRDTGDFIISLFHNRDDAFGITFGSYKSKENAQAVMIELAENLATCDSEDIFEFPADEEVQKVSNEYQTPLDAARLFESRHKKEDNND
ncbi:hypothetical protein [Caproicibacterium amylolyticum]|uniref:Uncharacterized protein n=1 Tax=Caproicibacterium amylolyticum TaxID=2766537 RepID=A0A7G9WJW4_9FIRM|nr:hypothetical protein [Caproicibacterium amylolyticum]QNO18976.1 hypothetical protein H6X83_04960 [Caproicibacterium amylolyticum]